MDNLASQASGNRMTNSKTTRKTSTQSTAKQLKPGLKPVAKPANATNTYLPIVSIGGGRTFGQAIQIDGATAVKSGVSFS